MRIKEYLKNEIFVGSLIVIVLTFLGNVFSYLFQFISARMLGPEDYVVIAVVTSLIAIFAIPSNAIQTVLSKNTTPLIMKNKKEEIKGLLVYSLKKLFWISLIFFGLYSLFAIFLSSWLNIKYSYLFITGFFIFGSFFYPVISGIAQGMKKFKSIGFNFLLNCFVKFFVGISFIVLGFRIYGAIFGFLAGIFVALVFFLYDIRDIIKSRYKKHEIPIFSSENFYPLLAMVIFVLLFNIDVVIAKAFFSSEIAGKYSVVSLIGKIILFVISSIALVLLPVSSEKHLSGKDTKNVLNKTLGLSLIVCLVALLGFLILPNFIVGILFGSQYLSIASILFYVGLAFSFLSFVNVFIVQAIATNTFRTKSFIGLFLCFIIEIFLLILNSSSIKAFSIAFAVSGFISLLVMYLINKYAK
jgi:O-antigen/teichoic acid export membrane protein